MTRRRRSSRRPPCASSASARPRSASRERSWNSSKRTAAMPSSEGSSRIMRANTPSVTTSMRVLRLILEPRRTRRPTVSPTASPSVCAMRAAAARAASRRGSSTMILPPFTQGSSSSTSGTRVVLPAPGGATSTAFGRPRRLAVRSSRTASMGRGLSKARMPRDGSSRGREQGRCTLYTAIPRPERSEGGGNPLNRSRYGSPSRPPATGDDTHHVMAGLVPAIPVGKARRFSDRDHRHKAGDDVGSIQDVGWFQTGNPYPRSSAARSIGSTQWIACMPTLRAPSTLAFESSMKTQSSASRP